jgi:hypothetical protein
MDGGFGMNDIIEVEIDASGTIHPKDPSARLPQGPAFLTWQTDSNRETMLLSEAALAADWLRPEEDEAWAYMQPGK